ncbi:MAG TPA: MFS transporter [Acholeplasmataceae bacterium]|jgi:PPP family 3-phenylpropionic acid transporter|nr:MFS transporter [Acholeplasmataceae bacterium]HPX71423.1 MFS transporter [Acholeplasmataceae bacterium]
MKETFKYQLTTFIRYMGDAFIYPFLALYLRSIGLANSDVGKIMMIMPLVAIFINPIWSKFSKNINYNRIFIRILTVIEAIAVVILANIGANVWLIILVIFIIAVVGQPYYILFDSFTVMYAKQKNISYATIRIVGTLSYAITVIISGLVASYSYQLAFYIGAGLFVLTSLLITFIKPLDINVDDSLSHKPEPKELFRNKPYWRYVFVVTFTLTSMFIFDTYVSTFLKDIYLITEFQYGIIVSSYIFLELFLLILWNKIGKNVSNLFFYLLMIGSLVIRYGTYALSGVVNVPLGIIIAVTMLRSIPISVSIYMMMEMISKLVKPYNVTIATIIMGSIRSAFSTAFVLIGGYLTTNPENYKYWFLMGIGFTLLSLIFIDYKNSKTV